MILIYGIVSVLLIGLFIYIELKDKPLLAFFLKGLASFSFIGLFGVVFLERYYDLPLSQIFQVLLIFDMLLGIVLILLGLLAGLIGDLFLALRPLRPKTEDQNIIVAGMIAFSVGHIFYMGALFEFGQFSWWAIAFSLIATLMVYIFSGRMNFQMGITKWPMMIYSFLIFFMLGTTINFAVMSSLSTQAFILLLGAGLFVISDLLLAPIYFLGVTDKRVIAINLVTYYMAQLLIALSIYYVI